MRAGKLKQWVFSSLEKINICIFQQQQITIVLFNHIFNEIKNSEVKKYAVLAKTITMSPFDETIW